MLDDSFRADKGDHKIMSVAARSGTEIPDFSIIFIKKCVLDRTDHNESNNQSDNEYQKERRSW